MSDSEIRGPRSLAEELTLEPDGRLRAWLRERDRLGVLTEAHAALDDALARGYAQGLEEARADALDQLRTLLASILEIRFGEIEEQVVDRIAEAPAEQLQRWIVAVVSASSLVDVLEPPGVVLPDGVGVEERMPFIEDSPGSALEVVEAPDSAS